MLRAATGENTPRQHQAAAYARLATPQPAKRSRGASTSTMSYFHPDGVFFPARILQEEKVSPQIMKSQQMGATPIHHE
jgi:hypothetical protein